ncbi:unnamed protein product, partial [Ixodes hexagonus]
EGAKGRRTKEKEPAIRCDGCGRWCYLDETEFDGVPDAEERQFECRVCGAIGEAMEETWRVRWEEMRAKMKDVEERKEAEERQVEQLGEKMTKEGERLEEMQREWEVRLREADERAERERKECETLRQAVSEMEQGKKKLREREGQEKKEKAKKEQLEGAELGRAIGDMGLNKTSENSEQGNEGEKTRESPVDGGRSYVEVLTQERQGKRDDKDEDRCEEGKEDTRVEEGVKQKRVIVVGSSNVTRCVAGVRSRVGGEEKERVAAYPGKCMSEVMESAKELVWENQGGGGENLVIVHAGLNDVLRGRGHNLGRQIEAGVRKLREAAEKVHIVMCTIPEVQRQAKVIERGVVEANWVIGQLGRKLGYQVMEVNREVYQGGTAQPFDLGGLHYGTLTGWQIGERMGGRARAFLGARRALR